MKLVLAISGGIDSMVMLHRFKDDPDVVVAHFNHGTRPSADDDQAFVQKMAQQYHKKFFTAKQNLGPTVSEERARTARYKFLFKICQQEQAILCTAHHQDDLLESVAINLTRGTGWRGLTPLDHPEIIRPLINQSKNDIRRYAAQHKVIYREDPTNHEPTYLRNRLREKLAQLPANKRKQLLTILGTQATRRRQIDSIVAELLPADHIYQRSWFTNLDDSVALEILRAGLQAKQLSATRPQLKDFLQAIRTYAPGKAFNLPGDYLVKMHKTYFML